MEGGVGSRLGRASSRYGPSTTTFSGPVRKWKKQWVHVSFPPSITKYNNNNAGDANATSSIRLRRWTPVPAPAPEEPPRRKFRYTPIVALEGRRRGDTVKVNGKSSKPRKTRSLTPETVSHGDGTEEEKLNPDDDVVVEENPADLELGLNGSDENNNSDAEIT